MSSEQNEISSPGETPPQKEKGPSLKELERQLDALSKDVEAYLDKLKAKPITKKFPKNRKETQCK